MKTKTTHYPCGCIFQKGPNIIGRRWIPCGNAKCPFDKYNRHAKHSIRNRDAIVNSASRNTVTRKVGE